MYKWNQMMTCISYGVGMGVEIRWNKIGDQLVTIEGKWWVPGS